MSKYLKLIFIALFFAVVFVFYTFLKNNFTPTNMPNSPTPSAAVNTPSPYKETIDGFRLNWVKVKDAGKISLHSNLAEKSTSGVLYEKNNCLYLVSAGFYNKENAHIGLFAEDFNAVSESVKNDFFDGYFYVEDNLAQISLSAPANARFAVQSGPVLMINNRFLIKNFTNDEYARRILVGVTKDKSVVFMTIFGDNKITGPKLADLKNIIAEVEESTQLDFTEVLNLDGGSHSAFISDEVAISEISTIGGYFCVAR